MVFSDYLDEHDESLALFEQLRRAIVEMSQVEERESKSQVAFRRRRTSPWPQRLGQYLGKRGAPLVLSVVLPERDADSRWKEVVERLPGVFIHHLELHGIDDIDDQTEAWIKRAYDAAQ